MSNDCISRQDAIDAMHQYSHFDDFDKSVIDEEIAVIAIKDLPSVQPDLQPTCNQLATDTISRQAAIDELIAMREHIDARMSVIGCTAYEMAIEALREPEQRWIPCAELLPEEDGRYLITGRRDTVYSLEYEDGRWYGGIKPVAWMPLPEPWKGEHDG